MRDTVSMAGAEALVDALQDAGVRCIFSLSGNQIMPIYDALLGRDIRLIHFRHEAAAVYAAEAWAQLTGQLGVALVTAGAGFGNALGAMISAQASESPVLLLSGDSPRAQDGMGAFQELDQCAMSAPVTKASLRAGSAETLASEAAGLIREALSGRPGPVHLALPADVLTDTVTARPDLEFTPPVQVPGASDLAELRAFLDGAARPLILTGPSLSNTRSNGALARAQAALNAPVLCMESPRGLRDPSLGALVDVTRQADRIVLLGKSGDFTTGFLGQGMGGDATRFAVIDPDPAEIARAQARLGPRADITGCADSLPVLLALSDAGAAPDRTAWLAEAARATSARAPVAPDALSDPDGLHPAAVGQALAAILRDHPDAVFISDGGEFGQWMQAIAHDGPRVINGVSGAIGAAPAYAIAASIARPDVPVIAVMGDGTAGFLLAEYETAAREDAGFIAVIGNDSCWNAEHQIQIREFGVGRTHSCTLSHMVRYDEAARGLGAQGLLAADGKVETLSQVLSDAQQAHGPICVNIRIRPEPAPVVPSRLPQATAVH